MPLCRSLGGGLWEIRTSLSDSRISRVLFCAFDGKMVLLHGFIKKSQKTPKPDLDLAKRRMKGLQVWVTLQPGMSEVPLMTFL
jgi:phage-related protein